MTALDPRTKLALLLAFMVVVVFTPIASALAIETLPVAVIILALGFGGAWLRVLRAIAPLLLFLAGFYFWAFDWETALAGALRLTGSVSAFFLFFRMTTPEDLGNSLVQSGVPYPFAFILITAMQFAPVLSRQVQDVLDAQRARGIRLELDIASVRNFTALLAPLLIQAFALAEQLAEAMETRGFGSPNRTFAYEYRMRTVDYMTLLGGLGCTLAAIVLVR
jgi:energy-coupling factor transport system permease protein